MSDNGTMFDGIREGDQVRVRTYHEYGEGGNRTLESFTSDAFEKVELPE